MFADAVHRTGNRRGGRRTHPFRWVIRRRAHARLFSKLATVPDAPIAAQALEMVRILV
jgi:hypothetical protein